MLDGLYALPNQNPQACEPRDEFACVGVQLQTSAGDSMRDAAPPRDPSLSGGLLHAKLGSSNAPDDATGMARGDTKRQCQSKRTTKNEEAMD